MTISFGVVQYPRRERENFLSREMVHCPDGVQDLFRINCLVCVQFNCACKKRERGRLGEEWIKSSIPHVQEPQLQKGEKKERERALYERKKREKEREINFTTTI